MLPRIHPQEYIDVRSAVRDFVVLSREKRSATERASGHHGVVVLLLLPVMRTW